MKQLLLFFTITLLPFLNIHSQSAGTFSSQLCSCNTGDTVCNNTSDTYTIVMPYDGRIVLTGTVSSVNTGSDTIYFSVLSNISYTDFEGNPAGQTVQALQNIQGPNYSSASNALLAGISVDIGIGMSTQGGQCVTGNYTLSYEIVPMTYSNDIEPNDDYTEAIITSENLVYQGHGGFIPSALREEVEGSDWYKLVVPRNGFLNIDVNSDNASPGFFDTQITVYRSNDDGFTNNNGLSFLLQTNSANASNNGNFNSTAYCVKEEDIIYLRLSGTSNSYQFSWNVQAPDGFVDVEPNDLSSSAISIAIGETKTGNIGNGVSKNATNGQSKEDLEDWYTFTTVSSGDININLSSSVPLLSLLPNFFKEDDNGDLINVFLSGSQEEGFSAPCSAAGTYYINLKTTSNINIPSQVFGACEDCCTTYSLSVNYSNPSNFAEDSEPNNTFSEALYVSPNIDHEGQVGYRDVNGTDNADRYELNTDFNGDLSVSFTNPMPPNSVQLYYFSGSTYSLVGNSNTNTNDEITSISYNCAAAAESYILSINASECLSYQFNYTNTYYGDNNETEPNNTIPTAQVLNESDAIYGQVGYGQPNFVDGRDLYNINITESAPLKISVLLDTDTRLRLFRSGSVIPTETVTQDSNSGPIEAFVYNNTDTSYTYQLEVTNNSGCGNYEILEWSQGFSANNDAEPNNSQAEATAIIFDQLYEGQLSYVSNPVDGEDYYRFSLTQQENVELILNAYEGLDNTASLKLYDTNGNQVFQLDHDGTNSSRTTNNVSLDAGSYYFIISGTDQTGSYDFNITPQSTLNINTYSLDDLIVIYPIPATDKINIKLNTLELNINSSIYDVTGKIVNTSNLKKLVNELDISTLENGIYFIQLKSDNASITKRFIKH